MADARRPPRRSCDDCAVEVWTFAAQPLCRACLRKRAAGRASWRRHLGEDVTAKPDPKTDTIPF